MGQVKIVLNLALKPKYLQQLQTLLREHAPWAEVWAYGSRVSGSGHEASDLDLVLRNPQDLSRPHERLGELKEAFSENNIPILIDILDWARIPAHFREEIERTHIVVQK